MNRIDMVLDTDTYNEVDDQFALVYALLSKELDVKAVYAAPFHNERSNNPKDGMERSYDEIVRLLTLMNKKIDGFVFKGSDRYMGETPCENEAVHDLIKRARTYTPEHRLHVASIGAPTNISSAITIAPDIIKNIKVVWLGGNDFSYPSGREFNLMQDYEASCVLFDSGVELVQIPCWSVASHLMVGVPELRACMGSSAIAGALVDIVEEAVSKKPFMTRVIWDISAIAYLINSQWVLTKKVHSPVLNRNCMYSFDERRHFIDVAYKLNRNQIFEDMYLKIRSMD
ncbi:MAG: nucleoside hydrolase [Clostridia bacterium]|nr:nucleoside hydrolase [Clostridia bacterium]